MIRTFYVLLVVALLCFPVVGVSAQSSNDVSKRLSEVSVKTDEFIAALNAVTSQADVRQFVQEFETYQDDLQAALQSLGGQELYGQEAAVETTIKDMSASASAMINQLLEQEITAFTASQAGFEAALDKYSAAVVEYDRGLQAALQAEDDTLVRSLLIGAVSLTAAMSASSFVLAKVANTERQWQQNRQHQLMGLWRVSLLPFLASAVGLAWFLLSGDLPALSYFSPVALTLLFWLYRIYRYQRTEAPKLAVEQQSVERAQDLTQGSSSYDDSTLL